MENSRKEKKFQVEIFEGIEKDRYIKKLNEFLLTHKIKNVGYMAGTNSLSHINAIVEYYVEDEDC